MKNITSFSIGCFDFSIIPQKGVTYDLKIYRELLSNSFKEISNIESYDIYAEDIIDDFNLTINEDIDIANKEYNFIPNCSMLKISLTLILPENYQIELLKKNNLYFNQKILTSKFTIYIFYTFHYPVTFIEYNGNEIDTTDLIVTAREFFNSQSEIFLKHNLAFKTLGPSPFHANFFIKQKNIKNSIEIVNNIKSGYNIINCYYNTKYFKSYFDAKYMLYNFITQELGFYYKIIQIKIINDESWEDFEYSVDNLVKIYTTNNIVYFFKKIFLIPKYLKSSYLSLINFQNELISSKNFIDHYYKSIYDNNSYFLKHYIDVQINEFRKYPIDNYEKLLNLIESRRKEINETLIIIIASIIGGVIGSVITYFLK